MAIHWSSMWACHCWAMRRVPTPGNGRAVYRDVTLDRTAASFHAFVYLAILVSRLRRTRTCRVTSCSVPNIVVPPV